MGLRRWFVHRPEAPGALLPLVAPGVSVYSRLGARGDGGSARGGSAWMAGKISPTSVTSDFDSSRCTWARVSDRRTSLVITDTAAFEMWRRLADKSIARIGLPLARTNDTPPFTYERRERFA